MSPKAKKLLILYLPYFILGLVATKLGLAWRMATGADMSREKPAMQQVSLLHCG